MVNWRILLVLVAAFACKSGRTALGDRTKMVELRTGACFGYCPVIRLTVYHDGFVAYEGSLYAEKTGRDSFRLQADEVRHLREKVAQVNLWQYPDRIRSEIADAPSATLVAFRDGQEKQVNGSIDRPAPLLELENLIKDLAEAHGFQVKRGVNPNDIPPGNRGTIIVRLDPAVNAGNWIRQVEGLRLQLERRLGEANIWQLAFDTGQITETTLLERLKKTPGVLEVQANRAVQERH